MQSLKDVALVLNAKYSYFESIIYMSSLDQGDLQRLEVRSHSKFHSNLKIICSLSLYQTKLQALTKEKDWIFPANQTSEMSDIKRVEDIIRAEFFQRLYGNLPYVLTQENVGWTELPNGTLRIDQHILVEHDSQQKIVKGSQGKVINSVIKSAREQIEKALKRPIKLFLQIKTR
jgi:GTPase Era involved in 16S rRNA processing